MNAAPTPEEKDYQLIQRFFDFELDDKELEAVTQRLETDDTFRKRMRHYETVETYVDEKFNVKERAVQPSETSKIVPLNAKATTRTNNRQGKGRSSATGIRNLMRLAAVLVILIISVFVARFVLNQSDPAYLSQRYWNETDKVVFNGTRMSNAETSDMEALLIRASAFFLAKDYQATLNALDSVTAANVLFDRAALLRGEAYFALEAYDTAIENFQLVLADEQSSFEDVALWFQALAYIKQGELGAAEQNLELLIEEKYPQAEKASELLEKIRR